MVEDIFIIIGKVLWFLLEAAFAGVACPVFLVLGLGDTPEATARQLHDFLTMGIPFWSAVIVFLYIKNPKGFREGFTNLIARIHYFFVPHPAESAIDAGRRYRTPQKIDPKAVVDAMKRDPAFDPHQRNIPPAYQSENKRKKAEALREAAEADRKLLEELEEREWARRRLEKTKRGET